MNKEFVWTDAEVKKILHAATGNIKDFVMNEDGFISEFKASHTTEPNRDWEIVSVKNKKTKDTWPYKEPFYPEYWDIHSVRRLSDNSVWTVGDDCFHGPIVRFNLRDNQITADFEYGDVGCSKLLSELSKPLQRTPDSIKPPIGIMPEYIWKEQRLYELNQAMIRYINAGLSYPKEWGFERENIINETKPKQ